MWVNSKKWLAGLLLVCLLSVLSWPIFSDGLADLSDAELLEMQRIELEKSRKILTEWEAELIARENTLTEERKRFEEIKADWTALMNLWPVVSESMQNSENELKSEYWRGFFYGYLIGVSVGGCIGGYGGFSIGIRIRLPSGS